MGMYEKKATRETPATIVLLTDVSLSMQEPLDNSTKLEAVETSVNNLLRTMRRKSRRGEIISPRYRLAIVAYSSMPTDVYGGVKDIVEVSQIGAPVLSVDNMTNTAAGFEFAKDIIQREIDAYPDSPPPLLVHLTDGEFNEGGDPEPIAEEIKAMHNADGNVLLQNIFVGPHLTKSPIGDIHAWPGVTSESDLASPYVEKLYRMSSPMPESFAEALTNEGYSLQAGTRMLIPATRQELVQLAFTVCGVTGTGIKNNNAQQLVGVA